MASFVSYLTNNVDRLTRLATEHLQMALAAVALGLVVGIPLGVIISRVSALRTPVLWLTNALQTIPALALAGVMMIFLGLGRDTAIVVLFAYTLMPIVQATYTGIQSVDAAMLEAARGMGMTRWQILRMVEFPLAFSLLLAGLRLAVVLAIGSASIMSLIGAGGLGYEIFTGISRVNTNLIIGGAAVSALLAVTADLLLGALERRLTSPGLRVKGSPG